MGISIEDAKKNVEIEFSSGSSSAKLSILRVFKTAEDKFKVLIMINDKFTCLIHPKYIKNKQLTKNKSHERIS